MITLKQSLIPFCLAIFALGARGQGIPNTEIFLVKLKAGKETLQAGTPTNITQRPGYDNQPSFTPDGKSILFTSQRDGQQTDIFQYTLAGKKTVQLTNTPEAEYSPLVTPDGKSF